MTFDPSKPQSTDSPGLFPAQSQTNFSRIQTVVGANHQFNLSSASDDGYHNVINLTEQSPSGPVSPPSGRLYSKTSGGAMNLFSMDQNGIGYQISPSMPIRAAVNFNGTLSSPITPRSSFNVSTVTKSATGRYTISFTTAIPNNNYIVVITGMRSQSSKYVIGCVEGNSTYGNSVAVGSIKINFISASEIPRDVIMANVVVLSTV